MHRMKYLTRTWTALLDFLAWLGPGEPKPLTAEQEKNINDQADRCW
jgi:hypothetical protein